jgi:hypothetical protein
MQRSLPTICVSSLILMSASAAAVEPAGPSAMLRQQISNCMTKKMAADKALSYNEAMRTCKARLQPSKDTLALNDTAPPTAKPH